MTEAIDLRRLKTLAKRYARANRIAQHQALDLVAGRLGFPSWVKLVSASKAGWKPSAEALADVDAFAATPLAEGVVLQGDPEAMRRRSAYLQDAENGSIGEHPYSLQEVLDDVIIAGDGWSIRVPENPSATPVVETYTASSADCPVFDPSFLQQALDIAKGRAMRVRSKISTDWPRRSTKPDRNGVVRHPLGTAQSDRWFCLHCDSKITGAQIAKNMWHCPACGGSPLDIFETAFWLDDGGLSLPLFEIDSAAQPDVQIVDGRPKLDLSADKIELLVRSALLNDAADVSERLGALQAEITVDEDSVFITLDMDLWPEDKDPVEAIEVARLLGFEAELDASMFTTPFAWPALGKLTSSTREYTEMMLDAYAQYDGLPKGKVKSR